MTDVIQSDVTDLTSNRHLDTTIAEATRDNHSAEEDHPERNKIKGAAAFLVWKKERKKNN